jgi:hypothetical protein
MVYSPNLKMKALSLPEMFVYYQATSHYSSLSPQ